MMIRCPVEERYFVPGALIVAGSGLSWRIAKVIGDEWYFYPEGDHIDGVPVRPKNPPKYVSSRDSIKAMVHMVNTSPRKNDYAIYIERRCLFETSNNT